MRSGKLFNASGLCSTLVELAQGHRFKLWLLRVAHAVAEELGLPILSREWSLLEAVFYGLYMAGIIEEQFFIMWQGAVNCHGE